MSKFGQITIQNFTINLNSETQISKNGRPFRLSCISLVTDKPTKYVNGEYCHGTIYSFRYLDKDEFFGFEFSPDNVFICKVI